MAKTKVHEPSGDGGPQDIVKLQARYQDLNTRKINAEADLRNANERLADLQRQAREDFGTDDVAELRRMLDEMKAENERKRAAYQADLDRIEKALGEVESQFGGEQIDPDEAFE